MSTLKQELQKIVDGDLLNTDSSFICNNLSRESITEFENYIDIASLYASDYFQHDYAWWKFDISNRDYVISEKYRFIKDLIKTL